MSLPARLGWGLALTAALSVLVPALAVGTWARWEVAERRAQATAQLEKDLTAQREAWERYLQEESAVLVRRLQQSSPASGEVTALRAWAEAALAAAPLDLLWVLSETGEILACGHWPARGGGSQASFGTLTAGGPQVRRVVFRDRDVTGLLLVRPLDLPGQQGQMVVGLDLARAARTASPPVAQTRMVIQSAGEDADTLPRDESGHPLMFAAVPLVAGDAAAPHLAGQRPGPLPLPPMPAATLAVLVLVAALVAGTMGAWLGRRTLAPLGHLDEMAAALSHGRLDMELDGDRADEIGHLAESFNRMIGALRRQRRELETSARLAAWRDAARHMAHEVKNPLTPIRLSVENLAHARRHAPEQFPELFQEECRTILDEVDALTRLVDSFSRFARLPEPRRLTTPAADPARQVVRLHREATDGVELRLEIVADPGTAEMDPELVGQVLKNLVLNALAMVPRPGGEVSITCEGHAGEVVYQVRDNGPGIPPEVRDHLFEPHVSARPGGTGLGLAVARQIVMAHDGQLDVENLSPGTCFRVRLPRTPGARKES